jgi:hypothetical protein
VNHLSQLQSFITRHVGEAQWLNLCESMETVSVMAVKKMAGEEFVEEHLTKPIAHMLDQLGNVELQAFEHFLETDQHAKGMVLDAIALAKKARGLK